MRKSRVVFLLCFISLNSVASRVSDRPEWVWREPTETCPGQWTFHNIVMRDTTHGSDDSIMIPPSSPPPGARVAPLGCSGGSCGIATAIVTHGGSPSTAKIIPLSVSAPGGAQPIHNITVRSSSGVQGLRVNVAQAKAEPQYKAVAIDPSKIGTIPSGSDFSGDLTNYADPEVLRALLGSDSGDDVTADEESDDTPTESPRRSNRSVAQLVRDLFDKTNEERARYAVAPLKRDRALEYAAQGHSDWMCDAQTLSHTSDIPGQEKPSQRIHFAGTKTGIARGRTVMSENVLYNSIGDAETMINQWMNSQGHRENLLNSQMTQVGIGVTKCSNGLWYVTANYSN